MRSETIPLLQLLQTRGVGLRAVSKVMDRLSSERLSLSDFIDLTPESIRDGYGLTYAQAASITENLSSAEGIAEVLDSRGIRTILRSDAEYPPRLKDALDGHAPPVLFAMNRPDLLQRRGVGFCGARDASSEAIRCADQLARALVEHDLLIVSGHAAGVDEATHFAALDAGGQTALVLPEGILQFRARKSIARMLTQDNSVIVSEFSPKLPWSVSNAMQRNRTICGLVHAMVVVEAGTTGGTWEAGLSALKLGVPLFVLDYSDPAPSAGGNPILIKRGGIPLPCRLGKEPDLSVLLRSLNLALKVSIPKTTGLFDHIA